MDYGWHRRVDRSVAKHRRSEGRQARALTRERPVRRMLAATLLILWSTAGGWVRPARAADEGGPGAVALSRPFTLQVGDVITVSVWKNQDLSVTVPVRPDGIITLPLVGDVNVLGKTPVETQAILSGKFRDFVTAPAVSVVVNEINSWKVFVLGEIRAPGEFDIIRPTRLIQVLAMAGGFTEYAKKDEIVLLRSRGDGGEDRVVLSVKDVTTGKNPSDNVLLQPGDTIIVP